MASKPFGMIFAKTNGPWKAKTNLAGRGNLPKWLRKITHAGQFWSSSWHTVYETRILAECARNFLDYFAKVLRSSERPFWRSVAQIILPEHNLDWSLLWAFSLILSFLLVLLVTLPLSWHWEQDVAELLSLACNNEMINCRRFLCATLSRLNA